MSPGKSLSAGGAGHLPEDEELLLLVQLDDCTGEALGDALARLPALGARNIQLLSSVTKKGRPGHVLLIDAPSSREPGIAAFLAAELGAWGYHVLHSDHRHFDVEIRERRLRVDVGTDGGTFSVRLKAFSIEGRTLHLKADHDDVALVRTFLHENGRMWSLGRTKAEVEALAWREPSGELELRC